MNIFFRLLLTLNATSLLLIVFSVKEGYDLDKILLRFVTSECTPATVFINDYSNILLFTIPLLLTGLSIPISFKLGADDFRKGSVSSIEHANNSFLPSYLGYFFVALSINDIDTLIFVYGVLFLFTFLSQALYFNPLFLIYGYKFYNIKTKKGTSIFLISRHNYRVPEDIEIQRANRINNYTFIERGI